MAPTQVSEQFKQLLLVDFGYVDIFLLGHHSSLYELLETFDILAPQKPDCLGVVDEVIRGDDDRTKEWTHVSLDVFDVDYRHTDRLLSIEKRLVDNSQLVPVNRNRIRKKREWKNGFYFEQDVRSFLGDLF